MKDNADLLLEIQGHLGVITLNRPKALNALTVAMVRDMGRAFAAWKRDSAVRCVLIRGAGERGLCAGGDIRALYEAAVAGETWPIDFWREEYALNLEISAYPKPVVALMNGIVLGGGIGISAHASHRIVTETTSIAMPEVGIGLIPDVGGTYLLSRAPGELGTHIAMTAGRVGAADALRLNLADTFAPGLDGALLAETLAEARDKADVDARLARLAAAPGPAPLDEARGWIDAAYGGASVEAICQNLAASPEPAAARALEAIRRNSPTSLKVTLRALRRARELGRLAPCLDMELTLVTHCLLSGDFKEGVRAAVIDKDRNPQWRPARLEDVGEEAVADYFRPLAGPV